MHTSIRTFVSALLVFFAAAASVSGAPHPALQQIRAASVIELRQWDARVDRMIRDGDLRVRSVIDDFALAGRTHERADQYYKGVKVFGGDVAREIAGGQTISIYGTVYSPIDIDVTPKITADDVRRIVKEVAGIAPGQAHVPQLVVLPIGSGFALTWQTRVMTPGALTMYFVDARTGEIAKQLSDLKTQATAVGHGVGVLGDDKKLSVQTNAGSYVAIDSLRPPRIISFDMKGDLQRTLDFLNFDAAPVMSDVASDSDNNWTDTADVDAHAYMGYTYDYYYKRFNRQGLNGRNMEMYTFVHPVRRQDIFTASGEVVGLFYLNAFYAGNGIMVFGEGLPGGYTLASTRQTVDYQSGALDVVAHELTHGVTDYTSNLIYENESGALNEAFSDVMATGVEFFYQPPGNGLLKADYLIAEDTWRPNGLRDLSNPGAWGDPDHYSKRYQGTDDNGGVHTNSLIASHAFYLAIEGGTNRTSGQSVQGVGGANRDQIEKVFYRAFTALLPSNATFSTARQATIQSARELYGSGSPAERAVTQAWTAVGVQ